MTEVMCRPFGTSDCHLDMIHHAGGIHTSADAAQCPFPSFVTPLTGDDLAGMMKPVPFDMLVRCTCRSYTPKVRSHASSALGRRAGARTPTVM
ncbi:hypothetical protein ADK77_36745 [Streptomyces antibioticus]|nr:hypothetical protein ADK77_36745 [Streptomyces antibioticus]